MRGIIATPICAHIRSGYLNMVVLKSALSEQCDERPASSRKQSLSHDDLDLVYNPVPPPFRTRSVSMSNIDYAVSV